MKLFALAFLAGIASAFAFQPFGWWPLMPLAFAALCELIERAPSLRRALLTGWLFGLGQFTVGLNWIATAFTYQAAMPAWLGWIAVVLLSLYLAVYPMLGVGLAWRIGRGKPVALVLALAGAWALTEWLRAGLFTGFAWNPVAVSFVDTPLRGLSAGIGTYGLSAIVALVGGLSWLAFRRDFKPAIACAASIGIVALLFWQPPTTPPSVSARPVRVVQPNIGQEQKWREGFGDEAANRLGLLSLPRSSKPRLLVWPEAAITQPVADERQDPRAQVLAQFERLRATLVLGPGDVLVTGGIGLTSTDGRTLDGATNSVFAIAPGGRLIGRYDKAHLVPYGEYLPMRPLLSAIGLSRLAPGNLDFDDGPGPRTIALPGFGRMGVQVCYEIIFSGEVADRAHRPDFIFNPSNDAWFGRWGPPQHLAQARLRAAEEGLPVIRATPTGISAVIDADGRLLKSLPWKTAGRIDTTIPAARAPTLFARAGNIIPVLFGFLLLIAAIAVGRSRRYSAGDI
jgi:apolipoprotein N-acyltransferase